MITLLQQSEQRLRAGRDHHILGHFSDDRRFRLVGVAAAVLVRATAFTVWNSKVNEKLYKVSLFTIALLSWLAFRWRERLGRGREDNLLILMAFILALSVGNHLMAFLAAPALAIFIFLVRPYTLLNYRTYLFGIPAVVLGLSIHLFLPARSELAPVINQAAPTCETSARRSPASSPKGMPGARISPRRSSASSIPHDPLPCGRHPCRISTGTGCSTSTGSGPGASLRT